MKKIASFTSAALSLLLFASSCKKDTTPDAAPAQRKLSKVELTYGATSNTMTFTYNAAGRLAEYRNNSFTNKFDYSGSIYGQTTFNNASSKKTYEANPTSVEAGRVTAMNYISFHSSGGINYTEANNFQYGADGYLTNRSYSTYTYTNEYTAGNLTRSVGRNSGALFSESVYEYYTDKPDKFNLNWFEHLFQQIFLNDKEVFGKKNKQLLKKATTSYPGGSTYTYDFVYSFDGEGYVTNCTATESTNGVTSAVYNYKFFYQ